MLLKPPDAADALLLPQGTAQGLSPLSSSIKSTAWRRPTKSLTRHSDLFDKLARRKISARFSWVIWYAFGAQRLCRARPDNAEELKKTATCVRSLTPAVPAGHVWFATTTDGPLMRSARSITRPGQSAGRVLRPHLSEPEAPLADVWRCRPAAPRSIDFEFGGLNARKSTKPVCW